MAKRKTSKPLPLSTDLEFEILFEELPGQTTPAKRIDSRRLKPPRGARHWFTIRTAGGDYDIVLGTDKVLKCLKGAEGHTDGGLGIIALDEEATLSRIAVVLIHEMLHAVLSSPAEYGPIARVIGCRPASVAKREEDIVAYLAPKLADCLIRSGLLRLPPIPRRRKR